MEIFKNKIYNKNETRSTFIGTMNKNIETCPSKEDRTLSDSTENEISKSETNSEGILR